MDSKRDRLLAGLGAAVLSGLLSFFGTGYSPVSVLTWLAPLPVLLLAPRASARLAGAAAFVAGVLGSSNNWSHSLNSIDVPLPMALGISVGMASVLTLVVLLFRALVVRGLPLLASVAAPAVWTGLLYLVSLANPTGVMGTPANSMGDVPAVLQIASITGFWGIEFLLLFVPAAIATGRLRTGVTAGLVLVAVLGFGFIRLASEDGPSQRVALVVTNQRHWAVDVTTPEGKQLVQAYTDSIAALPADVRTVVLPEAEFGVDDASLPSLIAPFAQVARERGTDVVVGYLRLADGAKFNSAVVVPADGGEPGAYLKHHDMVSRLGDDLVLTGRSGVQICMDVNHADPSRAYAAAGARFMAIPAADEIVNGWQHARIGLLRGVENGFSVAWAGRTGALMVSDGYGRVVGEANTGGTGPFTTVVADVPAGPGATLYTRFGDWFAWLCLAITVAAVIVAVRRRREWKILPTRRVTGP